MAPPTPTPAPNGTNATPEHRPPPALPPDPSEADIHEFEAALRQGWRDEWGPYFRGKTNPLMVGEYMIFPLSSAFCVIAHPKEDTIRLSAAPLEQGYVRLLAGALASGKVDPTAQYGAIKSQGKANKMTPLVRDKVAQALQPLVG